MSLIADDEDEESIPKKSWEEGWNGFQPKKKTEDEAETAFDNYINNLGENDSEPSYADLTKKERHIVDEALGDKNTRF